MRNITFPYTSKLNPNDCEGGSGVQDSARKLRYTYFEEIQREIDATYTAVAHHENDQSETLILHLLRSVNPSSLGVCLIELEILSGSLLEWSKEDILSWVKNDESNSEDSSNTDSKYTRNRIRHEVLPLLEDIRKGTTGHLAEWSSRLRVQSNAVDSAISEASRDIIEYNDIDLSSSIICKINVESLGDSIWGSMIFDRLLAERGWPVGSREEAIILLRASVGAVVHYKNDELRRERNHISLSILSETAPTQLELTVDSISDPQGLSMPTSPNVLWVGQNSLKGQIIWRPWEYGDKISPSGMEGTVKVSDLLTQWKVPNSARENAHVLLDSTEEILWVFIHFENQSLSRISKKVSVKLGEGITVFKVSTS